MRPIERAAAEAAIRIHPVGFIASLIVVGWLMFSPPNGAPPAAALAYEIES
jgi:hypothetical protein